VARVRWLVLRSPAAVPQGEPSNLTFQLCVSALSAPFATFGVFAPTKELICEHFVTAWSARLR
jgi:hypothetical protein